MENKDADKTDLDGTEEKWKIAATFFSNATQLPKWGFESSQLEKHHL